MTRAPVQDKDDCQMYQSSTSATTTIGYHKTTASNGIKSSIHTDRAYQVFSRSTPATISDPEIQSSPRQQQQQQSTIKLSTLSRTGTPSLADTKSHSTTTSTRRATSKTTEGGHVVVAPEEQDLEDPSWYSHASRLRKSSSTKKKKKPTAANMASNSTSSSSPPRETTTNTTSCSTTPNSTPGNSPNQSRQRSSSHLHQLDEDGKWGEISKKEIYIVMGLVVSLLVSVTVVVIVFVVQGRSHTDATTASTTASSGGSTPTSIDSTKDAVPSQSPSFQPMYIQDPALKYKILMEALSKNRITAQAYTDILPYASEDLAELVSSSSSTSSGAKQQNNSTATTTTAVAVLRAAHWVIHVDRFPVPQYTSKTVTTDLVVTRFALAVIYYSTGGKNWNDATDWLSPSKHVCSWSHVHCGSRPDSANAAVDSSSSSSAADTSNIQNNENEDTMEIIELDLAQNSLSGSIPLAVALLSSVRVLWLNDNGLTGNLPGEALGALPNLFILYLQNNKLTGNIPPALRYNGVLETLFLHGNNFTGTWPEAFCPVCEMCAPPLMEFSLNCSQTPCQPMCCRLDVNCFD